MRKVNLLKRFITSSRKTKDTLENYNQRIEKSKDIWMSLFPKHSKMQQLDFYDGQKLDHEGLDYSLNIVWDMLERKGKKIRPALMMILGNVYKLDESQCLKASLVVETVHNATLIIDDIEDQSVKRRGEPCSHLKFGVDNSINAGVMGMFLPMERLMSDPQFACLPDGTKAKLMSMYLSEMKNIHLGLAWDIYWHNKRYDYNTVPTESDYIKMVESKTSVLLRIGFKMIAILGNLNAEETEKLVKLANLIGASFQIKDDIISLTEEDYRGAGTGIGDDITEGKITLMVIHNAKTTSSNEALEILHKRTTDQNEIRRAIGILERSGSLRYGEEKQMSLMKEAKSIVASLKAKNHEAKNEFIDVLDFLLDRRK